MIVLLVPALSNLERDSKIAKKEWPTLGKITTFSIQSNLLPEKSLCDCHIQIYSIIAWLWCRAIVGCYSPHLLRQSLIKFLNVPYRPTDDEVVYSKRLGNKVLVDLNRSNPLTVI